MTSKTFTILNVEDLANNRDLVRRILHSQGYEVIDAVNGLEGISKAIEIEPDLILMDINLPDIDGFSAVAKIRSEDKLTHTPIIALTARNVSDDQERAKAIGCDGYLSKPIGVKDLLDEVERLIGKQRKSDDFTKREHYLREHSVSLVGEVERKYNQLSRMHEELRVTHERLQRLDQAKTDFISIASHELRTPLTMVHVYTDMLRTHPTLVDNPPLADMMGGLRQGVDRLNAIIDDMISIVKVELSTLELTYNPLPLPSVIEPVLDDIGPAIQDRNLDVKMKLPDNIPNIIGDDIQLNQVFTRLIGNAIKYTPDFGKITVSATAHKDKRLTPPPNNGADFHSTVDCFVEIAIKDTGIGINKEDQANIFEKFYTAEDVSLHSSGKTQFLGGGPGLGLTIVKGIVEAHGGRIWVESDGFDPETHPGSTFYVLLPADTP